MMAADEPGAVAQRKGSVLVACVIGAAAGAALVGHRGARSAGAGAVAGAAGLAASEAVARARQRPGEIPPLWQRIATSATPVAPLGWAAGRVTRAGPVAVGAATGTLGGLLCIRPQKVLLAPLFGAGVGRVLAARGRPLRHAVRHDAVPAHPGHLPAFRVPDQPRTPSKASPPAGEPAAA